MEPDSVIAEIDEGLTRAGKLDAINADETTNLSFSDRHVSEVEADLPDEPPGGLEVSAGCHDGGASTEAHITKIVAPIVAGPPPPQPPRLFVLPAQQNTPRSAPLFVMPTRPVVTQVTPAVTVPQVQQVVAAVSMIPPAYQYVPLPQFQQPLPQYYQQPNISVSQRPMMQMHPAMQQMSNPFGQSTLIPPVVVGDPMNDMASWSEHEAEDKRKYWYNRVNGTSTYDKPFCLKTPEERSIPSCKWKEYTSADDKKYYSDGKESSWTVPEEYRIWRERMDAVEAKKAAALQTAIQQKVPAAMSGRSDSEHPSTSNGKRRSVEDDRPAPVYASQTEATDAFKAMLLDKKILTSMKMKEVTDICHSDIRFLALRTAGERKQALAEYQTKTLKLEKETLKSQARKNRDQFLILLAENTVIDARTRWREVSVLLQDDVRFKNVEDARDREDLFNDFVSELEKKEKEDRSKSRADALKFLSALLLSRHESGLISRRSTWAEERDEMLKRTELRALEDTEVKRNFQDYVNKLDFMYKEEERVKKVQQQRAVDLLTSELRELLEKLAYQGQLCASSRWQECCANPIISESNAYIKLEQMSNSMTAGSGNGSSASIGGERKEISSTSVARDVFEKVLVSVREASRADKRLIQDVLRDWDFEFKHTCTLQEFKDAVYTAAGVKTSPHSDSTRAVCDVSSLTEDGEEIEEEEIIIDDSSRFAFGKLLRAMLVKRPFALENIYTDLLEEEKRRQAKRETRLLALLDDYFFEQPNDTWNDCKRSLSRHPAYLDVSKIDREKVYSVFTSTKAPSKVKRKADEVEYDNERNKEGRDRRNKEKRVSEDRSSIAVSAITHKEIQQPHTETEKKNSNPSNSGIQDPQYPVHTDLKEVQVMNRTQHVAKSVLSEQLECGEEGEEEEGVIQESCTKRIEDMFSV